MEEKATESAKALASGTTPAEIKTSEKRNQLSALAGIDWMPAGWTITAQTITDWQTFVLLGILLAFMRIYKTSPIYYILLSAIVGVALEL